MHSDTMGGTAVQVPAYAEPAAKACTRCQQVKPLAEFGVHPRGKLGRQSWCRSCIAEHRREKRRAARAALA